MARLNISRPSSASVIFDRISAVFIAITILGVIIRYCWYDAKDPFKCGALLNDGEWLDSTFNGTIPSNWQVPGCTVRKYKSEDIQSCLAKRRALFIGDMTIRKIFWATARSLDPGLRPREVGEHVDITVTKDDVTLKFIWDPYLNSSALATELAKFNDGTTNVDSDSAAFVLMGSGLWYARHENLNGLKKWKDNIDEVVQHMREGRTSTDLAGSDILLLAPVLVPQYEWLTDDRRETITPEKIDAMNTYLEQLSAFQGVDVFWAFDEMIRGLPQAYQSSGIHIREEAAAKQAEALLNLRCNGEITRFPYDGTCCNKYHPPNYIQWLALVFVLAVLPVIIYMRHGDLKAAPASLISQFHWLPSNEIIHSMLIFGLVVIYCFYADRTQVFSKSQKQFYSSDMLYLSLGTLFFGLVTIRRTAPAATSDQPFLSREQSHEWKGLLLATMLIFNYTGGTDIAKINAVYRLSVAAYISLTGYGYSLYFLKNQDYTFKRCVAVLIRLNLLSALLPYMMGTDYVFYYLAPLATYWFLVIYLTLWIGEKHNSNIKFLLGKIFVSAMVTRLLPGILEIIFLAFRILAGSQWDVLVWRDYIVSDLWMVYIGMVGSVLFLKANENSYTYMRWFLLARRYAAAISALAIPLFYLFLASRGEDAEYSAYHSYVSFIPILSYLTLRNATPQLRNAHSYAFSWLGRCSLEAFALQNHIWMAADSKGLLELGAFGSSQVTTNFALATLLFLYLSHCMGRAGEALTPWVMGIQPLPRKPSLPITSDGLEAKGGETLDHRRDYVDVQMSQLKTSRPEGGGAGPSSSTGDAPKTGPEELWADLRVRVAVIGVVMWFASIVS
ncbi:Cas1p-domain-containing protein [Choiromyces venosus 120613-1]|uniref:Cas1p-domain-containing protein n=1 Tax=Choiromyces venosus 120613-1 TaxID=1336337 RepID=A0A3N4KCG6_9PEZI|nr:Cas1p-domain-containing protein [Choiromyces venosus 120613-1]